MMWSTSVKQTLPALLEHDSTNGVNLRMLLNEKHFRGSRASHYNALSSNQVSSLTKYTSEGLRYSSTCRHRVIILKDMCILWKDMMFKCTLQHDAMVLYMLLVVARFPVKNPERYIWQTLCLVTTEMPFNLLLLPLSLIQSLMLMVKC